MIFRCGLAGVVGLLTTVVLHSAEQVQAADARPNVLFILADDLGWADTTLNGHTRFHQTPHLDRLARRGMTFSRAYSASPLCSPTRSAILTGLSPARTGITVPNGHVAEVVLAATPGKKAPPDQHAISPTAVTRLKPEYRTLAEALKDAGYATGHFGKWHLGSEPYSPLQQGFDVDLPHHPGPGPAGSYVAPWKFKNFPERTPGEHIEDRMAAEAVAWMETQKDRPFLLNYWMFSVHAPFDAKRANIEKHRERINPADEQRSPTYAAMIQSLDDAIGTLLDALDRLGLAEKTIIIFTSDNGGNMYSEIDDTLPTSNRPLRGGKATMFEGGTRVPTVIAWPGRTIPGSRSEALIQSEDYYPTLLDGLGLKPAPQQWFDGISVLPALKGEPLAREAVFQYFPHSPGVPDWLPPAVSIHQGDWKLIRLFHAGQNGQHRYLLFNLKEDLGEQHNLAAEQSALVAELDARIERFLTETHAVVPIPNPAFDPAQYHPEHEGQAARKAKPQSKPATPAAKEDAALQGWKPRSCTAMVRDGSLLAKRQGAAPFLGFAPGKLGPEATLRFHIRCQGGGGQVAWLASPNASDAADAPQPIAYQTSANEWKDVSVVIPARKETAGIVRLFLPVQDPLVEIDWIELITNGKTRRWDF